eukprot:m.109714 g.109714  ORF g.109714 m.109714 type:complete len:492 (-) comp15899_c0_seq1:171-1646(-)
MVFVTKEITTTAKERQRSKLKRTYELNKWLQILLGDKESCVLIYLRNKILKHHQLHGALGLQLLHNDLQDLACRLVQAVVEDAVCCDVRLLDVQEAENARHHRRANRADRHGAQARVKRKDAPRAVPAVDSVGLVGIAALLTVEVQLRGQRVTGCGCPVARQALHGIRVVLSQVDQEAVHVHVQRDAQAAGERRDEPRLYKTEVGRHKAAAHNLRARHAEDDGALAAHCIGHPLLNHAAARRLRRANDLLQGQHVVIGLPATRRKVDGNRLAHVRAKRVADRLLHVAQGVLVHADQGPVGVAEALVEAGQRQRLARHADAALHARRLRSLERRPLRGRLEELALKLAPLVVDEGVDAVVDLAQRVDRLAVHKHVARVHAGVAVNKGLHHRPGLEPVRQRHLQVAEAEHQDSRRVVGQLRPDLVDVRVQVVQARPVGRQRHVVKGDNHAAARHRRRHAALAVRARHNLKEAVHNARPREPVAQLHLLHHRVV